MTIQTARPPARGLPNVATALLVLALGGFAGCGAPDASESDDPGAPLEAETPTVTTDGLQMILGVDQIRYAPDEVIRLRIRVVNRLDEPRTLNFSSGQRVDAVLLDSAGSEVLRWSDGQLFTQAMGEVRFDAGEAGESWELEIVAPEAPGSYALVGLLVATPDTLRATLPVEVGGS